ncbi:hypothetical protein CHS0354_015580 [Potamilus streckersoni]|uniref:Uncharacterized protein n=1 Tax=Potamilus streckersoni TaxID=2493646 RepID=A0AAE0RLF8_9BIVA|nr:hypothetical protein CHS0354_015580 [Potamilus streckersoni]
MNLDKPVKHFTVLPMKCDKMNMDKPVKHFTVLPMKCDKMNMDKPVKHFTALPMKIWKTYCDVVIHCTKELYTVTCRSKYCFRNLPYILAYMLGQTANNKDPGLP